MHMAARPVRDLFPTQATSLTMRHAMQDAARTTKACPVKIANTVKHPAKVRVRAGRQRTIRRPLSSGADAASESDIHRLRLSSGQMNVASLRPQQKLSTPFHAPGKPSEE